MDGSVRHFDLFLPGHHFLLEVKFDPIDKGVQIQIGPSAATIGAGKSPSWVTNAILVATQWFMMDVPLGTAKLAKRHAYQHDKTLGYTVANSDPWAYFGASSWPGSILLSQLSSNLDSSWSETVPKTKTVLPSANWNTSVRLNTQLVGGWATPLKNMKVTWDD